MRIGVSGASGHLGGAILRALKAKPGPHRVVGISRSVQSVVDADEARAGDYDVPAALEQAYAGLDHLFIIPTLDLRHGARARQLVNAINAACAAGVSHVTLLSEVGARQRPEPRIGAASWLGEQQLMKSAARWTILRANYFMESFAEEALLWQSVGMLIELHENRVGFVSREDVAAAAAEILLGAEHVGAIYHATGPELLSVAARADIITHVSGHPITVIHATMRQLRRGMHLAGFPDEYFPLAEDTKLMTAAGDFDMLTGDVSRLTGRAPVSLEQVLRAYFAPGAAARHGSVS